jgi:hypothetical protein
MSSVCRADQAVLLLREQLLRMSKRGRGNPGSARTAAAAPSDALRSIRELRRLGEIDERSIRKALVRALLSESLGPEIAASSGFQAMADKVQSLIEQDEESQELMSMALAEIA